MNTQDAIKALAAAGKGAEVKDFLERQAASAARFYRSISEDDTRTEDAKRAMLAKAYTERRHLVDEKLEEMAAGVVRTDRHDAERVFGVQGLPGDQASLIISRRDAADRVARVTERSELRELLARATRSGDEVLARAVAERAVEQLDDKTMHQFVADRPELDAAAERLWNARRGADTFELMAHLGALRPPELASMMSYEIERMA